uniref:Uncharacterized protein n=1 Tax=Timema bartmani TaxID=61472 RepID=A0A7R9EM75_9NEOP|nr:unnamed protein product [Timema bartmani]
MRGGQTGASERATERARLKDRTGSIFQARTLDPFTQPRFGASSSTNNERYQLITRSLASVATQSLTRSLARLDVEGYINRKCTRIRVEGECKTHFGKTTLSRPARDSNLDLPVIGSLAYSKISALDHAATEAVINFVIRVGRLFRDVSAARNGLEDCCVAFKKRVIDGSGLLVSGHSL